jgi:hypothetical protein
MLKAKRGFVWNSLLKILYCLCAATSIVHTESLKRDYSYKTLIHFGISEKRVLWNNQSAARIRVA